MLHDSHIPIVDSDVASDAVSATVLTDLLCDGEWRFAKIDVLKAAPKAKQSKVSEAVPC